MTAYQEQVANEIAQYENCENIHDLPPIYHRWSGSHLQPRFQAVLGVTQVDEFYATYIAQAVRATGCRDVASLGSGDGTVEIGVVKRLREMGVEVRLRCLELSPVLLGRARAG